METMSQSVKSIAGALCEAQKQIKLAVKDSKNPFFNSDYADLSSVWDACREALSANGLSVAQTGGVVGDKPTLVTTLLHVSGEWIRGEYQITPIKSDPQSLGSAVTYARRYMLAAMVGICPKDDDGESAMARGKEQEKQAAPKEDKKHSGGVEENTFIPKAVNKKEGTTNGKTWVKYGIKDNNDQWLNTFEKTFGDLATLAKDDKFAVVVKFKHDGGFLTITDLVRA